MNINKFFQNKVILITGGTGSIGTEITDFLIKKIKIKKIILFSRDEQKHFALEKKFNNNKIRFFIGDVRDYTRLNMALRGVDYVIHAAAQKHVALSEYNPQECVKTNIYGTENIINACIFNKVKKCILISTDKAVNPINIYGATKLAAEKLILNANNLSGQKGTIFTAVRYGNVLGSKGSVIPFFIHLTKNKQKIPLTDEEMTRFWISYSEAVNFILNSLISSRANEIYVPKLKGIKIKDIINVINRNSKIYISGIQKGEKIHEELISHHELRYTSVKNKNYVINLDKEVKKKILLKNYNSNNYSTKKINSRYIKIIRDLLK
jgi:UDP-N-acetylglucosamine 4,6-dehydratase